MAGKVFPADRLNVPLEPTYQAAYRGTPAVWREVLESGGPQLHPASGLPHSWRQFLRESPGTQSLLEPSWSLLGQAALTRPSADALP